MYVHFHDRLAIVLSDTSMKRKRHENVMSIVTGSLANTIAMR